MAQLEAELAAKPPIDRASLYRVANAAPWGVASIAADGRVDYANAAMERWLTIPAPAIAAPPEALTPDLRRILAEPLAAAFRGEEHVAEHSLRDRTHEVRQVRFTVSPRGSGPEGITGAVISLFDLTDNQALDRTVRENEARLNHINAVTPTANYIVDYVEGRVLWAAGKIEQVYGYSVDEMLRADRGFLLGLIHPDERPAVLERIGALAPRPDGEVLELEMRIRRPDGSYRWILDRGTVFERDGSGRVAKTLNAAIDIDERKRADERQALLINELNHRVKNTLAAVQSIARQTLRSGRSADQTLELFTARLVALSAAHNVLTRENWEGAGLREVAAGALEPFAEFGRDRIAVSGPDVRLGARAALGLSMALHELATNAAKYGSLSGDEGGVDVTWRLSGAKDEPRLELEWRETGGPPVTAPSRRGFGTRLLTQGLRGELGGSAELDFAAAGVVYRLRVGLDAPPEPAP